MMTSSTLVFEIGTEEIPAFDLQNATKQLKGLATKIFDEARIPYKEIEIYTTPRRLIVKASEVAGETTGLLEEYKGPSASIAFDEKGNPTKAAEGFARGKGLTVDDLEKRELDGAEYLYAVKQIPSQKTTDVLPGVLLDIINGISWPKSCRWSTHTVLFSRPVRWILALLGNEVIPVSYANLTADNKTRGHRFLAPGVHDVSSADELLNVLQRIYVVPSEQLRKDKIISGIKKTEQDLGLEARLPEKTLVEVINLTEYPTVLVGTFEEKFLDVPEEIIVDAMLMHQRYFPLYKDDKLTNKFIIVSNGNLDFKSNIINGNERVVRPRLSDAQFFYEEDLKKPLEEFVERLDELVFQETLGTVRQKTERMEILVEKLAKNAELSEDDTKLLCRAAYLAKADLVSNAVVEFTSVQGIMGSYYAKAAGEPDVLAEAIADHYRPRFAGDDAPKSTIGKLLALADKLDTISGLFAIDQAPTGSSDPFALRRNAIGIVNMLLQGLPVSLESAIDASLATYAHSLEFDTEKTKETILSFFITRTKVMLRDQGISADVIDAVLATDISEPVELEKRVVALQKAQSEMPDVMENLAIAYARANNLRNEKLGTDTDLSLFIEVEKSLYDAIEKTEKEVDLALERDDYSSGLQKLAQMREPIDSFFEAVKVMDDDVAIRENRLRLLNRFVQAFSRIADFGKLVKAG